MNLGSLIDLTFELEEEKTRMADELDREYTKNGNPRKMRMGQGQFEGYES